MSMRKKSTPAAVTYNVFFSKRWFGTSLHIIMLFICENYLSSIGQAKIGLSKLLIILEHGHTINWTLEVMRNIDINWLTQPSMISVYQLMRLMYHIQMTTLFHKQEGKKSCQMTPKLMSSSNEHKPSSIWSRKSGTTLFRESFITILFLSIYLPSVWQMGFCRSDLKSIIIALYLCQVVVVY